jgi:hypothetical protein
MSSCCDNAVEKFREANLKERAVEEAEENKKRKESDLHNLDRKKVNIEYMNSVLEITNNSSLLERSYNNASIMDSIYAIHTLFLWLKPV